MKNRYKPLMAIVLLSGLMFACANIGTPNGGPYDETPPKFVASKPAVNQLNFKGKKIEIWWDEFISIDNPTENVIVTPPQSQSPIIQAIGKKVMVELKDTLIENTTYTIDFTSSILDNNEKNAVENFSFAFSTGDVLDTLEISGVVMTAQDLEPVSKMMVGIHNNLSDTAFTTTKFLRTSKTDDRGRFSIRNIAPGSYHLFALEDKNRNFAYDKNSGEGLAFLDSIVFPTCERAMVPDTIWKDTITVDSVRMIEKTLFYPKDLKLWFFTDSVTPRQRMLRPDRPQNYLFTLKFNAPLDTFPDPKPLNFEPLDSVWYVIQKGEDAESFAVNYWILDSMIYNIDSLSVSVTYWKNNDTIPDLVELQTDTLLLANKAAAQKKESAKKERRPVKVRRDKNATDESSEEEEKERVIPLQVGITPSGSINPHDIITVKFNEPVMEVPKEVFVLEIGVDTLWEARDFVFEKDSAVAMTYHLKPDFKYEESYRLIIDSAALCGVYGHCNNPIEHKMKVKEKKEYAEFVLVVKNLPLIGDSAQVTPAFVELLSGSGAPLRQAVVRDGMASIPDIKPDKYYARLVLDTNGNEKWDAGSYEEKRQPELVYYLMKQLELRQNFKQEEELDIDTAVLGEKPLDLLKNKPKEQTKQKRDYREEGGARGGGSSIRGLGGLGF